ncbi:glycosyltransferase [Mycolicibacterium sp. SCSIO 43805]|uniref:glycosyltransferase n=1 Tax=Mycolicibacterium sp. SCSIO 43805 TaxID=3378074 RepID=UPI003AB1CDA2
MIFIAVGSDLPFDRLIRHVDEWAEQHGRTDFFAQIGGGEYLPRAMSYATFLQPSEFKEKMVEASAIIAHAGMGTILSAMQLQKPILVFPRRTKYREIRNEHQLATARHLSESGSVYVALDQAELHEGLNQIDNLASVNPIGEYASEKLIHTIREFICEHK